MEHFFVTHGFIAGNVDKQENREHPLLDSMTIIHHLQKVGVLNKKKQLYKITDEGVITENPGKLSHYRSEWAVKYRFNVVGEFLKPEDIGQEAFRLAVLAIDPKK